MGRVTLYLNYWTGGPIFVWPTTSRSERTPNGHREGAHVAQRFNKLPFPNGNGGESKQAGRLARLFFTIAPPCRPRHFLHIFLDE